MPTGWQAAGLMRSVNRTLATTTSCFTRTLGRSGVSGPADRAEGHDDYTRERMRERSGDSA